jgi:hypothetical protein
MMKRLITLVIAGILTLGAGAALLFPSMAERETAYNCEIYFCSQSEVHTHGVCINAGCTLPVNHEYGLLTVSRNKFHNYMRFPFLP